MRRLTERPLRKTGNGRTRLGCTSKFSGASDTTYGALKAPTKAKADILQRSTRGAQALHVLAELLRRDELPVTGNVAGGRGSGLAQTLRSLQRRGHVIRREGQTTSVEPVCRRAEGDDALRAGRTLHSGESPIRTLLHTRLRGGSQPSNISRGWSEITQPKRLRNTFWLTRHPEANLKLTG